MVGVQFIPKVLEIQDSRVLPVQPSHTMSLWSLLKETVTLQHTKTCMLPTLWPRFQVGPFIEMKVGCPHTFDHTVMVLAVNG